MHNFQSAVTYNTINSMHVCTHTVVPAAHYAMVYMLCIIIIIAGSTSTIKRSARVDSDQASHGQHHGITGLH